MNPHPHDILAQARSDHEFFLEFKTAFAKYFSDHDCTGESPATTIARGKLSPLIDQAYTLTALWGDSWGNSSASETDRACDRRVYRNRVLSLKLPLGDLEDQLVELRLRQRVERLEDSLSKDTKKWNSDKMARLWKPLAGATKTVWAQVADLYKTPPWQTNLIMFSAVLAFLFGTSWGLSYLNSISQAFHGVYVISSP